MLPTRLVFVDLETTGGRSSYDRIIEIGIIRVENNQITKTLQTLINPETHLPPEIEFLTGITQKDLETAPPFHKVAFEIEDILRDCIFVAHNVRFDYGFMKNEFRKVNVNFSSKHFCTVKLSRYLFPQERHHNLDAIMQRFHIPCENRHRAFDDAKVLVTFYQTLQHIISEETLTQALDIALKKPSLPPQLKTTDLDALPDQPGVYMFYGANGTPLYVGKSKNIRERVLSHFSADIHSSIEMKISQQIESIETIQTAGELGALFTESLLIKKMLPLYNRMLRLKRELIALKKQTDALGYERVVLQTVQTISPEQLSEFVGFFRSRKQAKEFLAQIAKEHNLCEVLLGLESNKSKIPHACFSYRLDQCKGACLGKENPLFYNLRFTSAFLKTKVKPWPFDGPILIEEKNEFLEITDVFLIDKWCYLGTIRYDTHGAQNNRVNLSEFDLDMYNILKRYLNNPTNFSNVRSITQEEVQHYLPQDSRYSN